MSYKDREKPKQNRHSTQADRWGSADRVTKNLLGEVNVDLAALQDWYAYCRFKYPGTFRNWTVEQFKDWNDRRIADLAIVAPPMSDKVAAMSSTALMANKVMLIVLEVEGGILDEVLPGLIDYKNALVEEYEANPCDDASRLMYDELMRYVADQGHRKPGELTPKAEIHLAEVAARVGK